MLFHLLQSRLVDEISRAVCQRTMQRQVVTLCQQRIKIYLRIILAGALSGCRIENDFTAKRSGNPRNLFADVAHSHDTPGLACKLGKGHIKVRESALCRILSGFYIVIIMGQLFCQGKCQRKGVLCNGVC